MSEESGLLHFVAFTWHPGTPRAAIDAVATGLSDLKQLLHLAEYRHGEDLRLTSGNADYGLAARFPSEAAWRDYMDHPAHRRLITEQVLPILAAKTAFQIRIGH